MYTANWQFKIRIPLGLEGLVDTTLVIGFLIVIMRIMSVQYLRSKGNITV